ncbi:MAG: prepilin-type N-terminal cleavage/methylation domain-containing protein [Nitrospirae bacterium]|nr:prepilin-type N-terminal cleavage/methylation domain-containing protein [Nitrospirota bacterium]
MNVLNANRGYTLLELLLVVLIVAILATVALPVYTKFINKARSVQAVGEISALEKEIMMYVYGDSAQRLPSRLNQLTRGNLIDPWGRTYQYVPFSPGTSAPRRSDRFSVSLNTDYDLYSLGEDGESAASLTAITSLDDVVRAGNGGYIGLVSEY